MKITVHIHQSQYSWEDSANYIVYSHKLDDTDYRTYVGEQEIEVEIPENYDPTAQKIAALKKEQEKLQAEFTKSVMEIKDRISKLQSLEYTA